jgi:hypothetical protein
MMKNINVKNLSVLCRFMEGLNNDGFTMERYVSQDIHRCLTPACALGWACTIPELRAQGLDLEQLASPIKVGTPTRMAEAVFGDVYDELFSTRLSPAVRTPQQWAKHCRSFLKSRGYDVLPASDGFKQFMDLVLKPVKEATPDFVGYSERFPK